MQRYFFLFFLMIFFGGWISARAQTCEAYFSKLTRLHDISLNYGISVENASHLERLAQVREFLMGENKDEITLQFSHWHSLPTDRGGFWPLRLIVRDRLGPVVVGVSRVEIEIDLSEYGIKKRINRSKFLHSIMELNKTFLLPNPALNSGRSDSFAISESKGDLILHIATNEIDSNMNTIVMTEYVFRKKPNQPVHSVQVTTSQHSTQGQVLATSQIAFFRVD